jgi:hypothetical protein
MNRERREMDNVYDMQLLTTAFLMGDATTFDWIQEIPNAINILIGMSFSRERPNILNW